MKEKEKYYYISCLDIVGKGSGFSYQVFRNGHWERDTKSLISDRLIGYDPFEPSDSPYGIGNLNIMNEMKEITKQEAMKIIRRQMSD